MATTAEEIRLVVKSELDKATKDLVKMNKKLSESDKAAKKNTKSFSSFGLGMIGVAAAVAGTVKFLKDAVSAASDLEEVTGKFNVVFQTTPEIFEHASGAVDELTQSYAMSTREARQYLSNMQDLLVPMGILPGRAAQMSSKIVKLSADIGSFNNIPTAQVMGDIQSAVVSNFETMKKYGIVLNETRVKQEAMNMGLFDGKGMLDAATKAQVAYALITRDSAAAIGDMARTQNSFANTMKAAGAFMEDMSAEIGQILLPALSALVGSLVDAAKGGNIFIESLKVIVRGLSQLIIGVGLSIDGLRLLKHSMTTGASTDIIDAYAGSIRRLGIDIKDNGRITKEGHKQLEKLSSEKKKLVIEEIKGMQDAQNKLLSSTNAKLSIAERYQKTLDSLKEQEISSVDVTVNAVKNGETAKQESRKLTSKTAQQLLEEQRNNEIEYLEFIGSEKEAALKKEEQEYLNLQAKFADNFLIKEELQLAHEERMEEIKKEFEQKELERQVATFSNFVSMTQNVVNKVSSIFAQYFKNQSIKLSNDYKKRKQLILDNVTDEDERSKQLAALEEEFNKKKSDLAVKQAKLQKKLDLIQAIQAGALGVARALSTPPPPVGIAFAAIIGALAATQVAMIARQPIPAAAEGALIKGTPSGSLIQAGEKGRAEAIIPLENEQAMDKLGGMGAITNNVTINVENAFFDREFPAELAVEIDKALTKLAQDKNLRLAGQI